VNKQNGCDFSSTEAIRKQMTVESQGWMRWIIKEEYIMKEDGGQGQNPGKQKYH
jgi:hypothetical protein